MRKTAYQFYLAFLAFYLLSSSLSGQSEPQLLPHQVSGLGSVKGYLQYLPENYSSNSNDYPVIIFLHGHGERGNGSDEQLNLLKKHGPPKKIVEGHDMCFTNGDGVEECFIVLCPQQGTSQHGWFKDVVPFVDFAIDNYRIDTNRIYLTGLSMGGDGCWDGMSFTNNTNNRFAAVAPIAGKGSSSEGCTAGERAITVWGFHGNEDTQTNINGHLQAINGYNNCKADDLPGPIFTEYDDTGHAKAWQNAYRTDNSLHTPNLYEWFLDQRKEVEEITIDTIKWEGTVNSNWHEEMNWLPTIVPSTLHIVHITNKTNQPIINSEDVIIKDLLLEAGAMLTISGVNFRVLEENSNALVQSNSKEGSQ